MNNIQYFLNRVLDGITLSMEEKNLISTAYLIKYHQALLEILITINSDNKKFFENMDFFFNNALVELDVKKRKPIDSILSQEKTNILADILVKIQRELPPMAINRIQKNLEVLARTNSTS